MPLILRCLLLALLTLTATVGQAMPCPMTARMAMDTAAPMHAPQGHGQHHACDSHGDPCGPATHAVMSLGDCLADQPPLPQAGPLLPAPAGDVAILPAAWPVLPRPAPATTPMRQPQPPPLILTATSAHWSSTQRLLL